MRSGAVIGIPLSLLQLSIHHHTHGLVDLPSVANNFLVCSAVYDADRLDSEFFHPDRTVTRWSAVGSSLFYASHPATQPLVPVVWGLHTAYTALKPALAPIKPFFVSAFWTIAVYYVPLLRADLSWTGDDTLLLPASFFLSIAALSHAADIVDREDDLARDIVTPAVAMTERDARVYTFGLLFASVWLHSQSSQPFLPYDVVCIASAWTLLYDQALPAAGIAGAVCLAYANAHDVELLSELLRSTEASHKWAIALSTSGIEQAFHLPEPYRSWTIKAILASVEQGDAVGRAILDLFKTSILGRLKG